MPHRLAVLRELGWPTAPCFCWPCDDASALIGDAGTPSEPDSGSRTSLGTGPNSFWMRRKPS